MSQNDNHNEHDSAHESHHILSDRTGLIVLGLLILLTVLTVVFARLDLGVFKGPIAIGIAATKALLVVLFFMGLKYDSTENRSFFASSFVFFAIFALFTMADFATREGSNYQGEPLKEAKAAVVSIPKFWQPNDELKALGAKLYVENACGTCHGDTGLGNGIAAGALNPRNFHETAGWKNGRKPSQIAATLYKGLNLMPAYPQLGIIERYALAHYVRAWGPTGDEDTEADLKAAGIDSSKDDGGATGGPVKRVLPVDFAVERYIADPRR